MMKSFLPALAVLLQINFAIAQTAVLLPNGEQQFFDNNGNPLTSGTIDFYAPNTTNRKTTWKNAGETIVNTNPVVLDSAGRAIIYGQGTYRQVVKDYLGNLIWDQLTVGPGTSGSAVTNFGDGNAVGTVKLWAGIVAPAQYQFAYGQQVLRVSFPDLYSAITQTISVICTSGSAVLSGISDTTQIAVGANVETSCVPGTGTVIATTASTVTLSSTANISTTVNATFFPFGNGNGATTFSIPDLRGYVMAGRDNMGGTAANRLTATYFGKSADALGASGGSQSQTLTLAEMVGHTHNSIVNDPGHEHTIPTGTTLSGLAVSGSVGTTGTINTSANTTGISITGTSSGGGVSISASLNQQGGIAESSALAAGGSGYTGTTRILTVTGGTCSTQPAFNVTIATGAVSSLDSINTAGSCTVYPSNPAATTISAGGGTGATVNVAFIGTGAVLATVDDVGSGYSNGNVTLLGGICSVQPVVTIVQSGGSLLRVSGIVTPGACTQFPVGRISFSGGGGTGGTLFIPFNPGGSAYTNGARVVTAQGGTCTIQPQFNATVVNNQITTIGAQVTPSNCSIPPSDPAPIVDAGGVAASATLITGGSSYTNGAQVLTVLGGTCTTQPQFNVNVSANVIASVTSLATAGACTINPSNPAATSGGGGIGGTLNVTYTVVGSGASANVVYGPQSFATIQPTLTMNYVIKVLPDASQSTSNVVTSINGASGAWTCAGIISCSGNIIQAGSPSLSTLQLLNAAPLPVVDLQTIVPVNGFYASGSGAIFQNCPLTGCVVGNHEQAAFYMKATAHYDKSIAEYMAVFDCDLNSGRSGVAVGISDNKVCFFNNAITGSNSGGGTWVQANNLVIGAGDTGTFKVNTEIDVLNNSADCQPGTMHDCWGIIAGGLINNPITSYFAASDFGQTPKKGAHFGYLVLGPNTAIDTDFEDSGGASNGFCSGCLQATSHSIAGFRDKSTTPLGLSLEGTYSGAAIQDTSTTPVGLYLRGTYATDAISVPGFSVNGTGGPGQIGILATTAPPSGGVLVMNISSTANLGIFVSNGTPTATAANGSIDLDTSGKLWFRTGGVWTQVTVP